MHVPNLQFGLQLLDLGSVHTSPGGGGGGGGGGDRGPSQSRNEK